MQSVVPAKTGAACMATKTNLVAGGKNLKHARKPGTMHAKRAAALEDRLLSASCVNRRDVHRERSGEI